ncbi:MAG: hypothetical protein JJ863_33305 [Deltaproteobacteria bacterium]|nr:hypothetical protein [Deltaproteobacteria bacterium]
MRVTPCRPMLFPALLLLGGCFLRHGSGDDASDDFVPGDAGPITVDAGPIPGDAGPIVDATPPPDAGRCRPAGPLVQACVEGDPAADFAPGFLVQFDDCHCGGVPRCDVEVSSGTAMARVSICDEGLCRACTGPNEVWCPLPDFDVRAIESGSVPHFELGLPPGDGQLCQTVGSLGGGLCAFPGHAWDDPEELCFPATHVAAGARVPLVIAGEVSCAFEPGPCDAELDDATRTIELRPRLRNCDEGAPTWGCVGASGRLERECWTPELRDGTYTVRMNGRTLGELTVGADAPAGCVDL